MKQDQAYQTKSKWSEFTSNSCNLGYHTYMMKDRCSNQAGEQDAAQEGRRPQRRTAAAAAAAGHTTTAAAAAPKKMKSGSSFNTQQQATSLCAAM
jgi:hypothetical protein